MSATTGTMIEVRGTYRHRTMRANDLTPAPTGWHGGGAISDDTLPLRPRHTHAGIFFRGLEFSGRVRAVGRPRRDRKRSAGMACGGAFRKVIQDQCVTIRVCGCDLVRPWVRRAWGSAAGYFRASGGIDLRGPLGDAWDRRGSDFPPIHLHQRDAGPLAEPLGRPSVFAFWAGGA